MIKTWMRVLYVTFSEYPEEATTGRSITFGQTCDDSKRPRIEVSGEKFLSPLKDNFVVRIYNLTYKQLIQIQQFSLFDVKVYAGYLEDQDMDSPAAPVVFEGGLVNMINQKREYKDNVAIFVCASKFIARAQRFRLSVSFNSGINVYSALKYVLRSTGTSDAGISDDFKYKYLNTLSAASSTPASFLDQVSSTDNSWFMNTDSTEGAEVNFWDKDMTPSKTWEIDISKGMMIGSAPEITSNGLQFTSLPVANYMPGQMIKIDNSYVDTSSGQDSLSSSLGVTNSTYLDSEGLYYIYSLSYSLSNTDGDFQVFLTCRARQYYDNVTGTSST